MAKKWNNKCTVPGAKCLPGTRPLWWGSVAWLPVRMCVHGSRQAHIYSSNGSDTWSFSCISSCCFICNDELLLVYTVRKYGLLRWHISANAKPREKQVQHDKTHAHHFKKHKTKRQTGTTLQNTRTPFQKTQNHFPKCFYVFWNGVHVFPQSHAHHFESTQWPQRQLA